LVVALKLFVGSDAIIVLLMYSKNIIEKHTETLTIALKSFFCQKI
jgi:hypothetical protein